MSYSTKNLREWLSFVYIQFRVVYTHCLQLFTFNISKYCKLSLLIVILLYSQINPLQLLFCFVYVIVYGLHPLFTAKVCTRHVKILQTCLIYQINQCILIFPCLQAFLLPMVVYNCLHPVYSCLHAIYQYMYSQICLIIKSTCTFLVSLFAVTVVVVYSCLHQSTPIVYSCLHLIYQNIPKTFLTLN